MEYVLMNFFKRRAKKAVRYQTALELIDLLIARLNRGFNINEAIRSLGKIEYPLSVFEGLERIESITPLNIADFPDYEESHFFIALLEVLRQIKHLESESICDALIILKRTLEHKVYYDSAYTHIFEDGLTKGTPEQFAKAIVSRII
jgi:3'-phosphoadenosine 5'-phosphosulfate sulfotransferase